jgi:hypothetical protein
MRRSRSGGIRAVDGESPGMKHALLFTLAVFALGTSAVVMCADPGAAQTAPASPAPAASASAGVDRTLDVNGVPVPLRDFAELTARMLFVYIPSKSPHATAVIVPKKQSEMPSYDPDFHYAGTDGAPDQPLLTMWISDRLNGKAPRDTMESAAILGLLDSGMGGPNFQKLYAAARDADAALGPSATDSWKNRRALSRQLTVMVDAIMEAVAKQRAAGGSTPP